MDSLSQNGLPFWSSYLLRELSWTGKYPEWAPFPTNSTHTLSIITRVKMYVCFGLLLARSCQARTIDLQCQSLSLRRAFLLRSVCLSCMSVSVSRSLAYVEQGRSTCNVNRYLSVELFCFAACACHCTWPSRVLPFAGHLARKIDRNS